MRLVQSLRRSRGFTLVELLVVVGIIALLLSILLPAFNHVREEALKAKCSANLSQIYAAMVTYANQNNGSYPRTYFQLKPGSNDPAVAMDCTNNGGPTGPSATPSAKNPNSFDVTNVTNNSVTASMFLLIKTTGYPVDIFVCPSSNAQAGFRSNKVLDWSNFEDTPLWGQTMSYSMNCPFPSSRAVITNWQWNASALSTGFPLFADLNPGITGGYNPYNNVMSVTHSSSTRDMQAGNSNNHHNKGQEVLYGDKSVIWSPTPFCGPPIPVPTGSAPFNDNIYTYRASATDESGKLDPSATSYPYDNLDSYLLPTDDGAASQPTAAPAQGF